MARVRSVGGARWIGAAVVAAALVLSSFGLVGPVQAEPGRPSDTVPGQRQRAEAELDLLRATQAEVLAEITRLNDQVATRRVEADAARRRADEAAAAAAEAQQRADAAAAVADRNRGEFRDYVTESFMRPPAQDLLALLTLPTEQDNSHVVGMVRAVADRRKATAQRFADEQAAATRARDVSAAAEATARGEVAAAEAAAGELEAVVDERSAVAADLEDRLERQLAEVESLRELDARAARELAAAEAAVRSAAGPGGAGTGSGRSSGVAAGPPVGPDQITVVRGIPIHRSIAANLESMLAAASADGVQISGSGYRSSARQVQLRQAHCGSTPFDVYEKPASQCSPPTARPGRSMHERGLAVDLTVGGRAITTRSSPAFRWLADNASRFGFFNLPSEPWHWSVNGS
jgi:hypothetical protein